MIHLQLVDASNWREAMGLAVRPEQQRFIADNLPIVAVALSKAYIRPGGLTWLPYAIYNGERMVGFVEIAFAANGRSPCTIYHFFIDYRYQGRGYSKPAMLAVLPLIRQVQHQVTGIELVVHPENLTAQRLYEGVGFRRTGEERWGEWVYWLDVDEAARE
ncbi:MAG: GNAT family N-acetyltransferase [Ardenticatenaceae bacterium]|nr:GNAT family N-acetyltransferase [Ardenticatenaceae bacterium]